MSFTYGHLVFKSLEHVNGNRTEALKFAKHLKLHKIYIGIVVTVGMKNCIVVASLVVQLILLACYQAVGLDKSAMITGKSLLREEAMFREYG
jgi:hypothetical protein